MIEKLDIGRFGVFHDMKWNSIFGKGVDHFNKVNIIYGENYSGKTTFSRIFDSLKNHEIHKDYKNNVDLSIYCNEEVIKVDNITDFKYDLMIYNSDFIERNLKWLIDDNESIQPFTIIGEKSVEIDKDIERIKQNVGYESILKNQYEFNMEKYFQQYKSLKEIGDNQLTNVAKEIRTNQNLYGKYPFDRTHLSNEIIRVHKDDYLTDDKVIVLSEQLKDRNLILKNSNSNLIEDIKLDLDNISQILKRTVTSAQVVEEWRENVNLASWIDEAYKIHKGEYDNCQFCGGEIKENVFSKIENHFTEESSKLDIELSERLNYINNFLLVKDYKINKVEFIEKEHENIEELNILIDEIVEKNHSTIEELKRLLEIKKRNHFNIIELCLDYTQADFNELTLKINGLYKKIIKNHNEYIENIENEKVDIRSEVFKSKVYELKSEFIDFEGSSWDFDEYDETLVAYYEKYLLWKSVFESSNETIESLITEERKLENSLRDEQLAITGINKWINYFFNDEIIKLDLYEENEKTYFKVLRNDITAKNLSEGERRIISFCYYLTMLQDKIENTEDNNLIIYIDDPISSLDHNHIFSIFSSINSLVVKSGNYNQMFISTHSLEFLKYLNRLDEERGYVNYYHISKVRKEEGKIHKSYLSRMPTVMREFSTEYQFLFNRIYQWKIEFDRLHEETLQGKIDNAYTNFYDLPNIIRRFLEIHLFYNDPGDKSLSTKVNEFIGDDAKSIKLNRIINEFSHTTVLERAMKPITIKELEECVDIILSSLESNNASQLSNLKNSL